ncbi:MAG: MFS transporter [Myxococcales bacterium]|jgi:MFS family permease
MQSSRQLLLTARFVRLLLAQTSFSLGWSLYLVMPKFYATALSADAETIGRLSAMGGFFAAACIPLVGRGLDSIGRKPFFRLGAGVLVLMSLGFLTIHRVGPALYVLQGLTGPAFVLAFNAAATLATDDAPPERMGQALGMLGASNLIMNAVSTVIAEALADAIGWHAVFLFGAGAGVLALLLSLGLYEPPRSDEQRASVAAAPWPLSEVWPLLLATLAIGVGFSAVFVFHQPYALSLGATHVRGFFVGFTATAFAARIFLGNLGDRFGRQRVSFFAAFGYVLTGLAMVYMDPAILPAYGALFGAAHGVLYPTLNAAVMERVGPAQRGRAMTLYNGAFNVGLGLAALGWGSLAQQLGYPAVFVGAALISAAGAGLLRAARAPALVGPPARAPRA